MISAQQALAAATRITLHLVMTVFSVTEMTPAAQEPAQSMRATHVLRQSATCARKILTAVLTRQERSVLMTQTLVQMISVTVPGHVCTPTTPRRVMTDFSAQTMTPAVAEPARVLQLTAREQETSATTEYVMIQQIFASPRQRQTEQHAMTDFTALRQMNVTRACVLAAMIPALTTEIIATVWNTAKKTLQLSYAAPLTR
jgi:hypothetical protein